MKKTYISVAIVATLASTMLFSSCIGKYALTNKILAWNKQVGNKFVNEFVFVAFWILPVYELAIIADTLIINSIEFWSGSNPVTAYEKVIDGKNGKYLVKCDENGYMITDLQTKQQTRFVFNHTDNSWAIDANGKNVKFMQFVDDNHVKMLTPDGTFQTFETSQQGLFAYEQVINANSNFALAR